MGDTVIAKASTLGSASHPARTRAPAAGLEEAPKKRSLEPRLHTGRRRSADDSMRSSNKKAQRKPAAHGANAKANADMQRRGGMPESALADTTARSSVSAPTSPSGAVTPASPISPEYLRALESIAAQRQRNPGWRAPVFSMQGRQPAKVEFSLIDDQPRRLQMPAGDDLTLPGDQDSTAVHATRRPRAPRDRADTGQRSSRVQQKSARRRSVEPVKRPNPFEDQGQTPEMPRSRSLHRIPKTLDGSEPVPATFVEHVPLELTTGRLENFTPLSLYDTDLPWPEHNREIVAELCLKADRRSGEPIRITERFRLYIDHVWQQENLRELSIAEFLLEEPVLHARPAPSGFRAGIKAGIKAGLKVGTKAAKPARDKRRRSNSRERGKTATTNVETPVHCPGDALMTPEQARLYYALPSVRVANEPALHDALLTPRTPTNVRNIGALGTRLVSVLAAFRSETSHADMPLQEQRLQWHQQQHDAAFEAIQASLRAEMAAMPLMEEFQYRMAGLFSRQIGMAVISAPRGIHSKSYTTLPSFKRHESIRYRFDALELLANVSGRCQREPKIGPDQKPSDLVPKSVWTALMTIDMQYCALILEQQAGTVAEIHALRAALVYKLLYVGAILPLLKANTNPFPRKSIDHELYEDLAHHLIERIELESLAASRKLTEVLTNSTDMLMLSAAQRSDLFSRHSDESRAQYLEKESVQIKVDRWIDGFKTWIAFDRLPLAVRDGIGDILSRQAGSHPFALVQRMCLGPALAFFDDRRPVADDLQPVGTTVDLDPQETRVIELISKLHAETFALQVKD
ncbi:MAG: hypothetical protein ACRYGK_14965 [Janthinobacterium lividum]